MRYERPGLVNFSNMSNPEAACMDGSTPAWGICVCNTGGNPASQGATCQGGCTAKNKCTNGVDAGFSGQPQGCANGTGAKENPRGTGCVTGEAVTDNLTPTYGGCLNGYAAMGCTTGNNRSIA
jgi:hypothetical protein